MESWMDKQVSLYSNHSDNFGRAATYRDILLTAFAMDHEYYDIKQKTMEKANDLKTIIALRKLDKEDPDYKNKKLDLKGTLQCFTPAALLKTKKKGMVEVTNRTNVMQLDFDYHDIYEYDVEELKRAVFSLPFVGFCGLSCSGDGFYALALIAEPDKLSDYAEHCFDILLKYGIKADKSKGKKVENLRYLSYDSKMLIRNDPQPLFVKYFKKKETAKPIENTSYSSNIDISNTRLVEGINRLRNAIVGNRWLTVQQVAYTLGGLGNKSVLSDIKQAIKNTSAFFSEEDKYCKCAEICFNEGMNKPYKDLQHV